MAMQVDNPLKYMGKKITAFTNMLATVTQMDIEIVDADLIRLGGTGGYAAGIGESIEDAGELYFTAMRTMRTICLDNPREHPICRACPNLRNCREMLNICSPIVVGGKTVGIIGLLCFSEER
ncbi:GAF domain-containing protein, partial [uncultured Desulfovibrio sp.]